MLFFIQLSSALLVTLSKLTNCVEVGVPERFLRPRNFNPHPYIGEDDPPQLLQQVADLPHPYRLFERPPSRGDVTNNGPVQFPKVPDAAQIPQQQTSARNQSPAGRLKPTSVKHPLNTVLNSVNTISPLQDFQVLELVPSAGDSNGHVPLFDSPIPAPQHLVTPVRAPTNIKPKNYAFSYAVKDGHSGDDFSHRQAQAGAQTMGEYRVKLPDGRTQVVSYTADHRGYRADVRYDEENLIEPIYSDYKPVYKPSYKSTYKPNYKPRVYITGPSYISGTTGKSILSGDIGRGINGDDYTPIHEENNEDNTAGRSSARTRPQSILPSAPGAEAAAYFVQSTPSPIDQYYQSPTISKSPYYNSRATSAHASTVEPQYFITSSTTAPQLAQEYYPSSTVPPQYHGPSTTTSSEHRYILVH